MTRATMLAAVAWAAALTGCGGKMRKENTGAPIPALEQVTPAEWQRLATRRLFFGHQSVGSNVIEGVQEILKANPAIPLRVVETSDPTAMQAPGLYHGYVGKNGEPDSKIADFSRIAAAVADSGTALMKFCYVDIEKDTDATALFTRYRAAIDSLRARHPNLTVVHVTLPLQVDPGTFFHWKTVLRGKQTPYRALNAVRARYNQLMRSAYEGREPLFDLAHFQALLPDGGLGAVRYDGLDVEYLASAWSSDGGHLNEAGRNRVAQALLVTLAKLGAGTD
jgi:lysophospholipase L1-like esterase